MKVFISWSGATSRRVAQYLRTWLPLVVQSATPFVSTDDIGKGKNWNTRLHEELATAAVGIIVVTRDNLRAPWLSFEAGALAFSLPQSSVCPFLVNIDQSDLTGNPLSQFQCTTLDVDDLCRLAKAIIQGGDDSTHVNEENLKRTVSAFFPDLRREIANITTPASATEAVGGNDHGRSPAEVFFSENYVENSTSFKSAMADASSVSISGFGHNRMSVVYASELARVVENGGRLRVLCMDPDGDAVLLANNRSFAPKTVVAARHQHRAGIATLDAIGQRAANAGRYELRVVDMLPPFTMYLFNEDSENAEAYVWFAPHRQPSALRPGFRLTRRDDTLWYGRFAAQFETMWNAAIPRVPVPE